MAKEARDDHYDEISSNQDDEIDSSCPIDLANDSEEVSSDCSCSSDIDENEMLQYMFNKMYTTQES